MTREPGDLVVLDPEGELQPWGFDWTAWLAEIGPSERVADSVWSFSGKDAALQISDSSIVTGQLQTQAKFGLPTRGVKYAVTNRITTTSGAKDDRTFYILGQDT